MDKSFSLGQWIKRRRKALDLTQDELAQRVGCSKALIAKIEADARRPSKQIAGRLADQLELAPNERAMFLQAARAGLAVDRLSPPTRSVPLVALAPEAALPHGTVTFLFTDIEGSTQLWAHHPQKMGAATIRHEALLHKAITAAGGVVFKTVGDAIYAAFASTLDAVTAAVASQRTLSAEAWGLSSPLRVRMALHIGVVEERGGDYFGLPLSRVARILAAGHGGQILLSTAMAELVREQLPPDVELRDLGSHRLKDLILPEQIFQLVCADLPADFPALQTLSAHHTNLPAQSTALIGREREIADVASLLRRVDVRLVTLTGPGGTGKTRLSLQVAADLLDEFSDGVWFVNMAPISDPQLVVATIAQTLDVREVGGRPLFDTLKSYLREKRILLVLDNFEQVVDAALVIAEFLAAAPGLNILVTSRTVLHLSGEREYAVPSLALPDRRHLPSLKQLTQYEAVRLFIDRAQAVKVDFAMTNENAPAVAKICCQLDGLPLAIELAAKRSKLFAPDALLAHLSNRLRILTGGARDLPIRQQTLRNTIDWSYRLLGQDQQMLFRRLAVFVGGCMSEAAELVCHTDDILGMDVLEGLDALADQSLLKRVERANGDLRFVLLETIREYALELLDASQESAVLRERHAAYYLRLAELAAPELVGREQRAWLAQLEVEQDNLRAALAWALEQNKVEVGLRLGVALRRFWLRHGLLSEGRKWLETLLARSDQLQLPGSIRADAQAVAGELAQLQQDIRGAIPLLEDALQWYQPIGDQAGIAGVLSTLGWVTWIQGDTARSVRLFDESLARYRELGDMDGVATVLLPRSYVTGHWDGDFSKAVTMAEESLRLFRAIGDLHGVATALSHVAHMLNDVGRHEQASDAVDEALKLARDLGDALSINDALHAGFLIAYRRGDLERAWLLLEEQLGMAHEMGDISAIAGLLGNLAMVARYQGRLVEAQALIADALRLDQEVPVIFQSALIQKQQGDIAYDQGNVEDAANLYWKSLAIFRDMAAKWDCAACIEGLAGVADAQGDPLRAVRLWSSAVAIREAIRAPLPQIDRPRQDTALSRLRTELSASMFEAAWIEGAALTLEQAIAYALGEGESPAEIHVRAD